MARTRFDPVAHAKSMRSQGFWIDKNYDEFLQQWIAKSPDKLALLAYRSDRPEGRRFTYAELGDRVSRAAASLKRMGIGRGDVISVQLPNWWEFAVIALAAFRVGAVVNPLMPIFREHELSYMLGFAATKVFVVPKLFRGFDHEAMAMSLRAELCQSFSISLSSMGTDRTASRRRCCPPRSASLPRLRETSAPCPRMRWRCSCSPPAPPGRPRA